MLKKFDMDDGTIVLNTNYILWAAPVLDQENKIIITLYSLDDQKMSVVVHGTLDSLVN